MTIKAVVRNGQLELETPLDLPDGTVVTIPMPEATDEREDSPEEIASWLEWYAAFEPLHFTDDERAAWEAARKEDREWELSQWESHSRKLEKLFP